MFGHGVLNKLVLFITLTSFDLNFVLNKMQILNKLGPYLIGRPHSARSMENVRRLMNGSRTTRM